MHLTPLFLPARMPERSEGPRGKVCTGFAPEKPGPMSEGQKKRALQKLHFATPS